MKTTPHHWYNSPTIDDVENRLDEIGFYEDYDYSFVANLANAISHEINGGNLEDSYLGKDPEFEAFASSLDLSQFSGNSPIAKATSIMVALNAKNKRDNKSENKQEEERRKLLDKEHNNYYQKNRNANRDSLKEEFEQNCKNSKCESNSDESNSKQQQKNINSTKKRTGQMTQEISDGNSIGKELSEFMKRTKKELTESSLGKELNPNNESPEVVATKLTALDIDRIKKIALINSRNKIKSKKQSQDRKISLMEDYDQVSKMFPISNIALPTFNYKFATKQLMIKTEVPPSKQLLVCAIDNSGSMNCAEKLEWVRAILFNRIDAVIKGEAELYIGWFIRRVCEDYIFKITNKREAEAFLKMKFYGEFGGGTTDIQGVIKQLSESVAAGKLGSHKLALVKPEILIINDGEDHIDPFVPKIKTHAFILGNDNKNLKTTVESSGGHYERFL